VLRWVLWAARHAAAPLAHPACQTKFRHDSFLLCVRMCMRPLLLRSLYWLAGVGAAAALAALLFGWAVGLALALLAALIGLGFHLYYLDKLLAWLDNPAPERTPEGMGGEGCGRPCTG
jgi:hypothetical protein